MALLNEEQINDILNIANVCSSSISAKKLIEWNEKQTAQQIEIGWNDAPKNATKAALRLHWITEDKESGAVLWSGSLDSVTFDRPAPVITPHPHAEMMMKYAEVAARRVDPWVEFERFSHCDMEWDGLPYHPDWTQGQTYRHIGDNK